MSFEKTFESLPERRPETFLESKEEYQSTPERWEIFEKNLGISVQNGKNLEDFKGYLELAEKNNLRNVQLDLREAINFEEIQPLVRRFKESRPEINLSFHLGSPSFSKSGEMINRENLEKQMEFSHECGADLVTIHPADIKMEDYIELSEEERKEILENSAQFLSESMSQTIEQGKPLTFAVENIGQTPDEIDSFLKLIQSKLGEGLEKRGMSASVAQEIAAQITKERLGITLDINHTLHPGKRESRMKAVSRLAELIGKNDEEIIKAWGERKKGIIREFPETVRDKAIIYVEEMNQEIKAKRKPTLEKWFDKFEDRIKCLHIYTPTIEKEKDKKDFQDKLTDIMDLYNEHNLDAPVYLETKKDSEITQTAFDSAKEKIRREKETSSEAKEMGNSEKLAKILRGLTS